MGTLKTTDKIMTGFLVLVSLSSLMLQIPLYFVCFWGVTPNECKLVAQVKRIKEETLWMLKIMLCLGKGFPWEVLLHLEGAGREFGGSMTQLP